MDDGLGAMVTTVVEEAGFEVILLRTTKLSAHAWIDREPGGVTIDDCVQLTREVRGRLLDDEKDFRDYDLEIQSPGLDRPITRPKDFQRFAGKEVKVRLKEPELGRKNFRGFLVGLTEENRVELKGDESWSFPLEAISITRLIPELPAIPKSERKPRKSRRKRPKDH